MAYIDGGLARDMLNLLDQVTVMSLHHSYPGQSIFGPPTELSGAPYERQSFTWLPASFRTYIKQLATPANFVVPGGSQVAWIGLWRTAGGSLPYLALPNTGVYGQASPQGGFQFYAVPFETGGEDILVTRGPQFEPGVAGQRVVFWHYGDDHFPTYTDEGGHTRDAFEVGTMYWARNVSADTIQVSLEPDGDIISWTTAGYGFVQRIFVETFEVDTPFRVARLTIALPSGSGAF